MKKIVRYIGMHVITSTLMIAFVVLGIEFFFNLIAQVSLIGTHQYGYVQAFMYVGLQLPQTIYNIFPMIGFLGSLIGLGKLSSGSELIVIRSSGFSRRSIIYSAMLATLVMVFVVTLIGEGLAPIASRHADRIRNRALQLKPITTSSHAWLKYNNTVAYIAKSPSLNSIEDITVFKFDSSDDLQSMVHAGSGKLVNGVWQLFDVKETQYFSNHVVTRRFSTLPLGLYYSVYMQALTRGDSMEKTVSQLWKNIFYLNSVGITSRQFQFQLWMKILQPVSTSIMILLGIPLVFGSLRDSSVGARLFIGIIYSFGFYMLNRLFGPISLILNLAPFLAAAIPSLLFFALYLMMMKREK